MEQGRPVTVRTVKSVPFSLLYEYPAEYKSSSESTAYAMIPDVVRRVHVKVGDKVKQDDIIISLSEDNATYQQAKIQVRNAETSFNRMYALYKENGVSKQDYDNALTALNVARESLKQVEEMIHIKAPISGTVTSLAVRVSANVGAGTPLFTISNQGSYEASFFVLPNEISDIRTGEAASITTGQKTIEGRVTEVAITMDSMRRAFAAKAAFDGASKFLSSGMNVDVTVEAYKNPAAFIVTQKEILTEQGKNYVFIRKGDKAEKREITLGRQNGLDFEATSGIGDGDELVTSGVQFLSDGEKIRIASE